MTKEHEIERLEAFTTSLPADSYLRPWLEDILPAVARDIQGDIFPRSSHRDHTRWQEEARENAKAIVAEAEKEAGRIRAEAEKEAGRIRANLRHHIESLLSKV